MKDVKIIEIINEEAKRWKQNYRETNSPEFKKRCEGALQSLFYLAIELGFKIKGTYSRTIEFLEDKNNNVLVKIPRGKK